MRKLIVLTGPTAVGKTALSIALAKALNGEIISADSMQVYRGMDVGTAKIRPEEMQGVPHHLIDVLSPTESFNVRRFQKLALAAMEDVYGRGRVPVLVGGTGFYIQAVLYNVDFTETDDDPAVRLRLEAEARRDGAAQLHRRLQEIDPASAAAIPAGNVKRIIRALEYHEKTGGLISAHNLAQRARVSPYDFRYFVLTEERQLLYRRIDARVDAMLAGGLVEEVERLRQAGVRRDMTSMQGLGYREIYDYLDGAYDLERAVFLIKRNTRRFAKRQLTWFKRERGVTWVDKGAFDRDDEKILAHLLSLSAAGKTLDAS